MSAFYMSPDRWVSDDGRSWGHVGNGSPSMIDWPPPEVIEAIRRGARITDNETGLTLERCPDGTIVRSMTVMNDTKEPSADG